jgi:hypothetical protein
MKNLLEYGALDMKSDHNVCVLLHGCDMSQVGIADVLAAQLLHRN